MERRRVVITGLGAVTPLGLTAGESWRAVREGVCGIGPITAYDPAGMKVQVAAEVKGFDPDALFGKPEAKRMGRFTQFALAAAREALADSGFQVEKTDPGRCAVMVSSGIGGIGITEEEHDRGLARGWDRVSPFFIPTGICNMAAGRVAIDAGFRGMCTCPVTACAGGTNAVGDAFHYIRDGYADACLCGGAEAALTPLAVGGFASVSRSTSVLTCSTKAEGRPCCNCSRTASASMSSKFSSSSSVKKRSSFTRRARCRCTLVQERSVPLCAPLTGNAGKSSPYSFRSHAAVSFSRAWSIMYC